MIWNPVRTPARRTSGDRNPAIRGGPRSWMSFSISVDLPDPGLPVIRIRAGFRLFTLRSSAQLPQVRNPGQLLFGQIFPVNPSGPRQLRLCLNDVGWRDNKVDRNIMREDRQFFVDHLQIVY